MKKIIITQDRNPQNPRKDDNLGTMVCFHKRYDFGDNDHGLVSNGFESWEQLEVYLYKEKMLLLYYHYHYMTIQDYQ